MKLRYIEGTRVYVDDKYGIGMDDYLRSNQMQIFKHRDIVHILNKLFKQAEKTPDDIGLITYVISGLSTTLRYLSKCKLPFDVYDKDEITFDDPNKANRGREPKLHTGRNKLKNINLKVIRGGISTTT